MLKLKNEILKDLDLTPVNDLAAITGVNYSTVYNFVKGKQKNLNNDDYATLYRVVFCDYETSTSDIIKNIVRG